MALYANGKLVEERSGDKVFVFQIPLEGEVCLEAAAGNCRAQSIIRRTDAPNPDYVLKKSRGKSQNWV